MMIGDWILTKQKNLYTWLKNQEGKIWIWPLRFLINILNFIFFQLTNLFAQLRWPFSAVVRIINLFHAVPSGYPIPVNDVKLYKLIRENQVVLVDFWTEWCGPCILMEGSLKELAKQYEGRIVVAKVDATINPRLTRKHNVMGYPTLILFFQGEELGRATGSLNFKSLVGFLEYYLEDV